MPGVGLVGRQLVDFPTFVVDVYVLTTASSKGGPLSQQTKTLVPLSAPAASPDGTQIADASEKLYADLTKLGIEVLFDDRPLSPGVKFNDADLIGLPLRITLGPRALEQGNLEFKWRHEKDAGALPLDGAADAIAGMVRDALTQA